jgi:hypothetical protein
MIAPDDQPGESKAITRQIDVVTRKSSWQSLLCIANA